jgi:hypothetical protein
MIFSAREALLVAGTFLADEVRDALLGGDAVDHAQQLVPPRSPQRSMSLALDLFGRRRSAHGSPLRRRTSRLRRREIIRSD